MSCGIYNSRPSPCRAFRYSYEDGGPREPRCDEARASIGLRPLSPPPEAQLFWSGGIRTEDKILIVQKAKTPWICEEDYRGFYNINGGIVLFWHRATSALSSPQAGLTSEFGMESGGTPPLKTPPSFDKVWGLLTSERVFRGFLIFQNLYFKEDLFQITQKALNREE